MRNERTIRGQHGAPMCAVDDEVLHDSVCFQQPCDACRRNECFQSKHRARSVISAILILKHALAPHSIAWPQTIYTQTLQMFATPRAPFEYWVENKNTNHLQQLILSPIIMDFFNFTLVLSEIFCHSACFARKNYCDFSIR